MKLNRGEWGEPYVALRLLGDGRLQMADGSGGYFFRLNFQIRYR